jgi:hypothetical protein
MTDLQNMKELCREDWAAGGYDVGTYGIAAVARIDELETALRGCIEYIESDGASALGVQATAKVTLVDFPPEVEIARKGYDPYPKEKGRFKAIFAARAALDQPTRPISEGKENRGGINVNPSDNLSRPAPPQPYNPRPIA